MTKKIMSVHEVAKLTGITARTLHYYDEIGILKPTRLTEAGYRMYDDTALSRLQSILLFRELGELKHLAPNAVEVQNKISALQQFLTDNYYICTDEILSGLGEMYVGDERFKNNIDKAGGEGTADFVKQAITVYCSKKAGVKND